MTVQLEAVVECAAKVLGQPQSICVLQILGVDDLEEHIVADDFRCRCAIVCMQVVGYVEKMRTTICLCFTFRTRIDTYRQSISMKKTCTVSGRLVEAHSLDPFALYCFDWYTFSGDLI